jgi:hypothetical protein
MIRVRNVVVNHVNKPDEALVWQALDKGSFVEPQDQVLWHFASECSARQVREYGAAYVMPGQLATCPTFVTSVAVTGEVVAANVLWTWQMGAVVFRFAVDRAFTAMGWRFPEDLIRPSALLLVLDLWLPSERKRAPQVRLAPGAVPAGPVGRADLVEGSAGAGALVWSPRKLSLEGFPYSPPPRTWWGGRRHIA